MFIKLVAQNGKHLAGTSVYKVGQVMIYLKGLGWTDGDILGRILPCYPIILCCDVEKDLQPVSNRLSSVGFSDSEVKTLLTEYPCLLLPDVRDELLPLVERTISSRVNRYVNSGSYEL